MYALYVVAAAALCWYLLRGAARFLRPARRAVARLSPWTRGLHAWVLSAPATFAYMAMFSATTVLQNDAPERLIDLLTRLQSTSLVRMQHQPFQALITSGLWVADHGSGLPGYLLSFGIVVAWAERRWGTPRIIVVAFCGHVFGSLLTNVVKLHRIADGHAHYKLALATDVGVSYVLVSASGAAFLAARGWWRWLLAAGLFVVVVLPVILDHSVWDVGHLLALSCGLAGAGLLRLLGPLRSPAPPFGRIRLPHRIRQRR